MYREIQVVQIGSGSVESREKFIGTYQRVINSSWWQNVLQKYENVVLVNTVNDAHCSSLLIALILPYFRSVHWNVLW
jgi:hypothetical protein